MSNVPAKINNNVYVTMTVADQLFGIPVMQVQDILGPQRLARVPLAPPDVAGALNLRGRIVTAIDMRVRLGLPQCKDRTPSMNVVVDHHAELYSLIVDKVGEVLSLSETDYAANPPTLNPCWQDVAEGLYRLKGDLLIVLNVSRVLDLADKMAA